MAHTTSAVLTPANGTLRTLPLSRIAIIDGFNHRSEIDSEKLTELAESIAAHGVLQPVLVAPVNVDGEYPLIAGHRRVLAAAQVGLLEIPALVREPDARTAGGTDLALVENLSRVNVTPLDQARGVQRLLEEGRLSRKGIASGCASRKVGCVAACTFWRCPNSCTRSSTTARCR